MKAVNTMDSTEKKTKRKHKIRNSIIITVILIFILNFFSIIPCPGFIIKASYRIFRSDFEYIYENLERSDSYDTRSYYSQKEIAECNDKQLKKSMRNVMWFCHISVITFVDYENKCIFSDHSSINEKHTRGIILSENPVKQPFFDSDYILCNIEQIDDKASYYYYSEYYSDRQKKG